jgi:hypothetical protein
MSHDPAAKLRAMMSAVLVVTTTFIVGAGWWFLTPRDASNDLVQVVDVLPMAAAVVQPIVASPSPSPSPTPTPSPTVSPATSVVTVSNPLLVPFTIQAPEQKWDTAAEDYCEEASMLMAVRYHEGVRGTLDPVATRTELEKIAAWEDERFGYNKDISAQEMIIVLKEYFGRSARLIRQPTRAVLTKELAAGRPIIVPAAGKLLKNPNFQNGGPDYHVFVITGVDGDVFITNDPGTRNGRGYRYAAGILETANHNYEGDLARMSEGEKVMIVVE